MVATLFTEDRALARQVAGLGGQQQQRSMQAMQNAQNMESQNQMMGLRASQDARANQQLGMQQQEQQQTMGLRASGEQRAAQTHKGNMQSALQDRVFKASAMTADMAGSLAFIDDPEKFEKAAAFMTSQPHFKLLDQDGSLAEVFKDQQALKDLAPAMRGYSQLYKEGADKREQALALQELMDKMEDRQFKRERYGRQDDLAARKLDLYEDRTGAQKEANLLESDRKLSQANVKRSDQLRGKFTTDRTEYDKFNTKMNQIDKIKEKFNATGGNISGADGYALMMNVGKLLDPDSVFREGEFATLANSGDAYQNILRTLQGLEGGQRMATPEMLNDLFSLVDNLRGEVDDTFYNVRDDYGKIAARGGLEVLDVLGDTYGKDFVEARSPQGAQKPLGTKMKNEEIIIGDGIKVRFK